MKRSLTIAIFGCALASIGGLAVGCGGDDTTDQPTTDGGPTVDGNVGGGDGSTGDGGGGDGGPCNFAGFVTDLIDNHTNGTDKPSTDLGQSCVDHQDQSEFKPLFK